MHRSLALSLLLPLAFAHPTPPSCQCTEFDIPLSFEAESYEPSFPRFRSHYDSVTFLQQAVSLRSTAQGSSPFKGKNMTQIDVTIAAQFCTPRANSNNIVQVLSHGLGFDHTYWDFGGPNSEYNYVSAATAAGYSTLTYDRLGNGKSTKTDPYTINQAPIEAQVLGLLAQHVRQRDLPALSHVPAPKKVVLVGHSFGSQITENLIASNPSIADAVVLTGWAKNATAPFAIASNYHLAKETIPKRYGNESTGYLTWRDELANQYNFLHWPNFSPEVLAKTERTKWPWSVSEMLTGQSIVAKEFKGPVMVISGAYDGVFCGFNCTGVLEQTAPFFPQAKTFETYMQPNTGHGLNVHYNATGTYHVITDFINRNVKD